MFSTDQTQPQAQGQETLGDLRNQPLRAQRTGANGSVGGKKKRKNQQRDRLDSTLSPEAL